MNNLKIALLAALSFQLVQVTGQELDSVQSGDYMIYYQLYGEGRPIYLLSGGPGITPDGMQEIAIELSKKYQSVLIHQRGTGKTKLPVNEQNIQIDKYCQDIRSIKKKLGHTKITLLGHSWGGMLSMHYATTYTADLEKLILVASGGYNLKYQSYFGDNVVSRLSEDDQNSVRVLGMLHEQISSLSKDDSSKQVESGLLTEYVNIITKGYLYDKRNAHKMKLSEKTFNPKILVLMMASLRKSNWDLKGKLEKTKIKTLILQGRQDPIDLETAREINAALKESELIVIEQCGHFPWIEQPGDFYRAVTNFLATK